MILNTPENALDEFIDDMREMERIGFDRRLNETLDQAVERYRAMRAHEAARKRTQDLLRCGALVFDWIWVHEVEELRTRFQINGPHQFRQRIDSGEVIVISAGVVTKLLMLRADFEKYQRGTAAESET